MSDQTTPPNPFAAWQDMMSHWSKAFAGGQQAASPFDAWRSAFSSWLSMPGTPGAGREASSPWQQWSQKWSEMVSGSGAAANPFSAWQEAMKPFTQAQPESGDSPSAAFELWLSTYRNWAERSAQFLNMGPSSMEFGLFNPFQGFNPFRNFTPYQLWQQLLQEYLNSWTEFMAKNAGKAPSSDVFRQTERRWLNQLDSIGKELAASMSTEEFSRTLGTNLEQSLVAQEKFQRASEDQVNAFLHFFHLPSRSQIDRLFQRVIAIEERLDDAEDTNRALLKQLKEIIARLEDKLAELPPAPKAKAVVAKA